jgi:hypothetical protein
MSKGVFTMADAMKIFFLQVPVESQLVGGMISLSEVKKNHQATEGIF